MIDFRYHLVSIVAIFLALAVGIVMGTTLLSSPAIESALRTSDELKQANNGLRGELDVLSGREAGNDSFVTAATPELVASDLSGERLVVIEAPGVPARLRESQQQVLESAGATVSGRITLTETYLDPAKTGLIDQLVTAVKPTDLTFPEGAAVYDKAAAVLAAAIVTTDSAKSGTVNPATTGVLDGFKRAGLIGFEGDPAKMATLAVVLTSPEAFQGENADLQAGAIVSLAGGVDTDARGTVMAGSLLASVAPGGPIASLRDNGEVAGRVSSVDNIDMPAGRVVVVYSLREQLNGETGQYGLGAGASAFQPVLPTTTPSPTTSGS